MVRMVARLCVVLSCLPVAFLGGCGHATSPLDAVADAGTSGGSVATGGNPGGGSGGSGGTGGQLAAPTHRNRTRRFPPSGSSAETAHVSFAQSCTLMLGRGSGNALRMSPKRCQFRRVR